MTPSHSPQRGFPLFLKRALDVSLSSAALAGAFPVMAIAGGAIRLTMGSPVLFQQERLGYRGIRFKTYKFRTMRNAFRADGTPFPDHERLTLVGKWLRKTSVDELPQLWNVVKGDMSLVGPRPLFASYEAHYSPDQFRRHDVLPGITGWAQINGRNATTWEKRFADDLWYVDNWSLALDVKIIALTILKVLTAEGVDSSSTETMPLFTGNATSTPMRKIG